jgi:hypothetical protein
MGAGPLDYATDRPHIHIHNIFNIRVCVWNSLIAQQKERETSVSVSFLNANINISSTIRGKLTQHSTLLHTAAAIISLSLGRMALIQRRLAWKTHFIPVCVFVRLYL